MAHQHIGHLISTIGLITFLGRQSTAEEVVVLSQAIEFTTAVRASLILTNKAGTNGEFTHMSRHIGRDVFRILRFEAEIDPFAIFDEFGGFSGRLEVLGLRMRTQRDGVVRDVPRSGLSRERHVCVVLMKVFVLL